MINLHNSYKLVTKEDSTHAHKLLGGICLAHYIYRYYLLFTTGTMSLRTPTAYYMIGIHGLLSCSSMIFHIPKQRIKGGPMIYPEYRLHSIVFALRSVVCYYLTYHDFPKIYNIGICFVTMVLADIITYTYPSGTTTMRQMPFESEVDDAKRKYIIMIQSFHQIGATLYMVGNEDACFSPMFAIQLAALLMTLVRKSIISANAWHIIYNLSLGINIFVYWSLSIQYIGLHIGLAHLFFYWRFYLSREPSKQLNAITPIITDNTNNRDTTLQIKNVVGNKYIGWSIVFFIFLQGYGYKTYNISICHLSLIRSVVIFVYCINHFYGVILPFYYFPTGINSRRQIIKFSSESLPNDFVVITWTRFLYLLYFIKWGITTFHLYTLLQSAIINTEGCSTQPVDKEGVVGETTFPYPDYIKCEDVKM